MHARSISKRVSRPVASTIVAMAVILLGWIIEHGGRPIWTRHSGPVRVTAYIHGSAGDYRLSRSSRDSCGTITYCRVVQSLDDALIATEVLDCRVLTVRFNNQPVAKPSAELRWRAFRHFGQPAILLGNTDGVRTLWLGFPGELLTIFWIIGVCIAAMFLLIRIMLELGNLLDRTTDPYLRRLRYVHAGVCPNCRYDIRGLPAPRCPECGEEWSSSEVSKAHQLAAARHQ